MLIASGTCQRKEGNLGVFLADLGECTFGNGVFAGSTRVRQKLRDKVRELDITGLHIITVADTEEGVNGMPASGFALYTH